LRAVAALGERAKPNKFADFQRYIDRAQAAKAEAATRFAAAAAASASAAAASSTVAPAAVIAPSASAGMAVSAPPCDSDHSSAARPAAGSPTGDGDSGPSCATSRPPGGVLAAADPLSRRQPRASSSSSWSRTLLTSVATGHCSASHDPPPAASAAIPNATQLISLDLTSLTDGSVLEHPPAFLPGLKASISGEKPDGRSLPGNSPDLR
jgi:hypothetical protein